MGKEEINRIAFATFTIFHSFIPRVGRRRKTEEEVQEGEKEETLSRAEQRERTTHGQTFFNG